MCSRVGGGGTFFCENITNISSLDDTVSSHGPVSIFPPRTSKFSRNTECTCSCAALGNTEPGAGPPQPDCSSIPVGKCNHTDGCGLRPDGVCAITWDKKIALARIADVVQGVWISTPKDGHCVTHTLHSGDSRHDGADDGADVGVRGRGMKRGYRAHNTGARVCSWAENPRTTRLTNATCVNLAVADAIWAQVSPKSAVAMCFKDLDPLDQLPFRTG